MEKLKKELKQIVDKENHKIIQNKHLLIEAFTKYYGEKHRERITNKINNLEIYWYVDNTYYQKHQLIEQYEQDKVIIDTRHILHLLGLMDDKQLVYYKEETGKFSKIKRIENKEGETNIFLEPDEKLDELLLYLFGEKSVFNYSKDNILYNYKNLSIDKQTELFLKLFGTEQLSKKQQSILEEIINYINHSISEKEKLEEFSIYKTIAKLKAQQEKRTVSIFKRLFKRKDKKQKNAKVIGGTTDNLFNKSNKFLLNNINEFLSRDQVFASSIIYDSETAAIFLPLLATSEKTLIHEMNHAICCEVLGEVHLENGDLYDITKGGLSVNDEEFFLEELITERTMEDIQKIFHDLGGNIYNDKALDKLIIQTYKNRFYFINKFYNKYKEKIKDARITLNKNSMFKFIDKNIYAKFKDYVETRYQQLEINREYEDKEIRQKDIDYIESLVDKMDAQPEEEQTNIKEQIKRLKEEKHKVRIINQQLADSLAKESKKTI